MALSQDFSRFAGKIISVKELKQKLAATGIDYAALDTPAAQEAMIAKKLVEVDTLPEDQLEAFFAQIEQVIKNFEGSIYISQAAADEIEKSVLQAKSIIALNALIKAGFAAQADGVYLNVQPSMELLSWGYGNDPLMEDYTKAVEACADHSTDVSINLQPASATAKKIAAKALKQLQP